METFSRSLGFFIGINEYGRGVPKLKTPVSDARALADLLQKQHDFQSYVLADERATLAGIRALLNGLVSNDAGPQEQLRQTVGDISLPIRDDDRVLFYFAGHGTAVKGNDGPEGFILPQDADRESEASFLSMVELSKALSELKCRHLLAILDCCFAGAFRWSSTRDLDMRPQRLYRERYYWYIQGKARQAIASAAHDEKALDVAAERPLGKRDESGAGHSPFAEALLEGLKGRADQAFVGETPDGVITASDLFSYIEKKLMPSAEGTWMPQTPLFWPLKNHEKGQFVFLSPGVQKPDLPPAPPLDEANNPWRGLNPYEQSDADLFFGRRMATQALKDRLLGKIGNEPEPAQPVENFIVVTGPSGIGKSSLVRAGLLPGLAKDPRSQNMQSVVVKPGPSPFASLAAALGQASPSGACWDEHALKTDPDALANWMKAQGDREVLLVIDQAEELITMHKTRPAEGAGVESRSAPYIEKARQIAIWLWDARRPAAKVPIELQDARKTSAAVDGFETYLKLVANALACPNLRVVLTVRSEFEPQFAESPLADRWAKARHVVPQMTQDELRRVIEGPAAVKVIRFENEDLIDRLVNEVVQMPGALPLLSFALSEMYLNYLKRDTDDRAIAWADYNALQGGEGGVASDKRKAEATASADGEEVRAGFDAGVIGALRFKANQLLNKLDPDHQNTARRVLERLVAIEGGQYARRRIQRSELQASDSSENERIDEILKRLLAARLIVTDEVEGAPSVELAHDALILGWDRLLAWVQEDAQPILNLRQLTADAEKWTKSTQTKPGLLWSDKDRLPLAKALASYKFPGLNFIEEQFVDASAERSNRNRLMRWILVATLMLLTIGAGWSAKVANDRRLVAEVQRRIAEGAAFTGAATNLVDSKPETAAIYAVHALRRLGDSSERSGVAEQVLRRALGHLAGTPFRGWDRFNDGAEQLVRKGVSSLSISTSEQYLAYATYSGQLYIWELDGLGNRKAVKAVFSQPEGWKKFFFANFHSFTSIAFTFHDRWLVAVDDLGTVRAFDAQNRFSEFDTPLEWRNVAGLVASPDGETVGTLAQDRLTLKLWRLKSGGAPEISREISQTVPIKNFSFSANGNKLLIQHSITEFTVVSLDDFNMKHITIPKTASYLKENVDEASYNGETLSKISPDGHLLVTSAKVFSDYVQPQRVGAVWDVSDPEPKELRSFPNRANAFSFFDFSPDSQWLALGRNMVELWDLSVTSPAFSPTSLIQTPAKDLRELAFDLQSKQLAVSNGNGTVYLLNLEKAVKSPNTTVVEALGSTALRFSTSGRWLAAANDYSDVARICDTSRECSGQDGGKTLSTVGALSGCSNSSSGWFIGNDDTKSISIWKEQAPNLPRVLVHLPWIAKDKTEEEKPKVVCSVNKRWLLIYGSLAQNRYLLDISADSPSSALVKLDSNPQKIDIAEFDPSGKWLIVGSREQLSLLSLSSDRTTQTLPLDGYRGGDLEFSPDGRWLLEVVGNGTNKRDATVEITLRSVGNDEISQPATILSSSKPIENIVFSVDGSKLFASESADIEYSNSTSDAVRPGVKAYLWDFQHNVEYHPQTLEGHRGQAKGVFSSDGRWLATVDGLFQQRPKLVRLWEISKPKRPVLDFELEAPAQVLYPMFDPDGRWFILGRGVSAGFYSLANLETSSYNAPSPDFELPSGTSITSHWKLTFSRDARWFVNQGNDEPLRLWWRARDGSVHMVRELPEQTGEGAAIFTPDLQHLLTTLNEEYWSTDQGTTAIWTLNSDVGGAKVVLLETSGEISTHDKRFSILNSGGATTWTIATEDLKEIAERVTARNLTMVEWKQVLPDNPYERTFPHLPEDASVFRQNVEEAQAAVSRGMLSEARSLLAVAARGSIDAGNPFAAMRVAHAGVSNDLSDVVLEAAEFAPKLMPASPDALQVRGLARSQTGNHRGGDDLFRYISWALRHGATAKDLSLEIDWAEKVGITAERLKVSPVACCKSPE